MQAKGVRKSGAGSPEGAAGAPRRTEQLPAQPVFKGPGPRGKDAAPIDSPAAFVVEWYQDELTVPARRSG